MLKRRPLSKAQRAELLAAYPDCHICGKSIGYAEWDVEHVTALADGGKDDDTNRRPAHRDCHRPKSAREATTRAHYDRIGNNWALHRKAIETGGRSPNRKQRAALRAKAKLRDTYSTVSERIE